jgi:hypothetical protein
MIPSVPAFALEQMAAFLAPTPRHGHGPVQGNSSPRPVVAGARHPQDTTARPLNGQPSRRDDIACRVLDAGGER